MCKMGRKTGCARFGAKRGGAGFIEEDVASEKYGNFPMSMIDAAPDFI